MKKELISAIKNFNNFPIKIISVYYNFTRNFGIPGESSVYVPVEKVCVNYRDNFVVSTIIKKNHYEIFRYENFGSYEFEIKENKIINKNKIIIKFEFQNCTLKLIGYSK